MKDSTELKFMAMFFAILATVAGNDWFGKTAAIITILYFLMWVIQLWVEHEKKKRGL